VGYLRDGCSATTSADYQRILPLRLENSRSMAAIVDGVKSGHTGGAKVDELLPR
jgi:hypothetical protein